MVETVEDTGGLTLVPAFSGLFAPHWREDARAVAVGNRIRAMHVMHFIYFHILYAHLCTFFILVHPGSLL